MGFGVDFVLDFLIGLRAFCREFRLLGLVFSER